MVNVKTAKFGCFAIPYFNDKVLMILRTKDGKWGFPGGKLEKGEGFYDATVRETVEEIGLSLPPISTSPFFKESVKRHEGLEVKPGFISVAFSYKAGIAFLQGVVWKFLLNKASHHQEVAAVCIFDVNKTIFSEMNLAPTVLEELKQVFGDKIK